MMTLIGPLGCRQARTDGHALPTLQCLTLSEALLAPTACRDHVRSDTSSSREMTLIGPLGCRQAMTDGGRVADTAVSASSPVGPHGVP